MTKPTLSFFIYAILFLLFSLFVVWFLRNFEYVSEDVYIGYQGKAKHNPLYAAQLLVQKMGIVSNATRSFHKLDIDNLTTNSVIILTQTEKALGKLAAQDMLYWTAGGGHLIIETYQWDKWIDNEQEDFFLNYLDIGTDSQDLSTEQTKNLSPIHFNWQGSEFAVKFSPYYLETEAYTAYQIKTNFGVHFMTIPFGDGWISITPDLSFMKNDNIAKHDHAQFFWQLIQFEQVYQPEKVWFLLVSASQYPNLYKLLWHNAKWIIITGSIFLFIWLWHISRRFGFILPIPAKSRRRLIEHIEATGHFLWQQKQAHYLLHRVQLQAWQRLAFIHPQWLHLPQDKLCEHLADITDIQPEEIHQAIQLAQTAEQTIQIKLSETDFTRAIQVFHKIRKVL